MTEEPDNKTRIKLPRLEYARRSDDPPSKLFQFACGLGASAALLGLSWTLGSFTNGILGVFGFFFGFAALIGVDQHLQRTQRWTTFAPGAITGIIGFVIVGIAIQFVP